MHYHHNTPWISFLKFLILIAMCTLVSQMHASNIASEQTNQFEDPAQHMLQKRTWKNLQGSWGKRSSEEPLSQHSSETEPDYTGSSSHDDNIADLSADSNLDRLNKYLIKGLIHQRLNQLDTQYDASTDEYPVDKRTWNKMNGGWGKRVNAGPAQWNKFRGAWGKREQGWNSLRQLWGKRSEKWNKLSSSWGKRDNDNSNSY
ncbi:prothoracicostatic peptide [Wyeomyia smithii]|uniref:prothoracicostatic peptide n=1 Tax=Wyeomyia smithii TaxID=174621 RepID=UPI002467F305|nr:prothoracicostatic peptide [Wyeomyia smithii]